MPEFAPGESKIAIAPITVKPAGLSCEAELFLGPDEATKIVTSGLIPFTSTGASQNVYLPVVMPTTEGSYHVFIDLFAEGLLIAAYQATEDVVIAPAVIDFTVTLINCPIYPTYAKDRYFTDGTGARVPCGQAGSWTVETTPFNFSIEVYTFWPMGIPPWYGWHYVKTYSFSATVENGKDYIYDCATGEFADITVARRVRAYWKGTGAALRVYQNGLTFNAKRAVDPASYTYGADLPYALTSTFIIPINATITQIEFKLLGVYGYYVRMDYRWTDQKPGGAEVIIAQGSKAPPYVADPYNPYTHYTVPI